MKRIFIILIVLAGVHFSWTHFIHTDANSVANGLSSSALAQLAATVKAEEVVMYSTTECTYCAQAKGWLNQNGFAFTECNMSVSSECVSQFKSYGADGTPFLIVRGHQMKNGFDSDEFISLLQKA
jgi:glutaredoxin